jgi:hypothetical protein
MKKLLSMALCGLLFASCNTTEQARYSTKESGFLKDYSMLKEGGSDEALLLYKSSDANWSKYSKVMIEPVQLWAGDDSDIKELDKKELDNIMSLLTGSLKSSLSKDFQLVDTSGAGTLKIRIALTEGEASEPVTDTLSSIVPITLALTYLSKVATGSHLSVGKASVEFEVLDSMTGERLAAGMDSRYGGKGGVSDKFESWADVKESFKYWGDKLNMRLVELKK